MLFLSWSWYLVHVYLHWQTLRTVHYSVQGKGWIILNCTECKLYHNKLNFKIWAKKNRNNFTIQKYYNIHIMFIPTVISLCFFQCLEIKPNSSFKNWQSQSHAASPFHALPATQICLLWILAALRVNSVTPSSCMEFELAGSDTNQERRTQMQGLCSKYDRLQNLRSSWVGFKD